MDSIKIITETPTKSPNIMDIAFSFFTKAAENNEWWVLLLIVFIISFFVFLFFSLKYKLFPEDFLENFLCFKKKASLEKEVTSLKQDLITAEKSSNDFLLKYNELLADYANTKESSKTIEEKIKMASQYRYEMDRDIADIKKIYYTEIEKQTEILVTKALNYLENWFIKNSLVREDLIKSDRCKSCRKISFYSSMDNLSINLKEQVRQALEKNGFVNLEGEDFDQYVDDKWYVFFKIIRESLTKYYILPEEFSEDNNELDKTFKNMRDVFYDLLTYLKEKETKMFLKMKEIEDDFGSQMSDLL